MSGKSSRVWTKPFTSLVGANTIYFFGFYMLMPTLPLYLASMGCDDAQVGAVATAFSIASIVTRMLVGYLLGWLGRSRTLKAAMVISAIVTACYCLVEPYAGIMLLRVVQGIAFGIVSTVCATLAADLLPDDKRGEGISFFGMGTTVAVALAPTLGLWLKDSFGFPAMFLTSAVSMLACLVMFLVFRPEKGAEELEKAEKGKVSLLGSLIEPRNLFQCLLMTLFGVVRGAESNYLSLTVEHYAIGYLSVYYIVQTAVSFVLKFFAGKMYDRYGHKASLLPGAAAGILTMLCMGTMRSTAMLMAAAVFSGIAVGAIVPTMQTWTINNVPAHRRSVASASYYNFYDLGMGGGAFVLGYVAKSLGYSSMYLWASLSMVLFMALYVGYLVKKKGAAA